MFRQGGVATEAAGQFEEHEIARMVAPLLFSFSDPDASLTLVARVGAAVASQGNAQVILFEAKKNSRIIIIFVLNSGAKISTYSTESRCEN